MTAALGFLTATVTLPAARDLAAFAPEFLAVGTVLVILLLSLFLPKRSLLAPLVTAAGGLAAAAAAVAVYVRSRHGGDLLGPAFSGLLLNDGLSCFLRALLYGFVALIAVLWWITTARRTDDDSAGNPPEFFVLLVSAAIGMALMVSTRNLLMVVIAIESASLPSYAMAGFQKARRAGAEAALKYVVFGAASAAMMVYGVSLLYGCFGTLDAGEIGGRIAAGGLNLAAAIGLLGLLVGVGFKISAVPFHFWCPDVFEGASVEVAAFLSVASKAAGLTLLLRLAQCLGQFDPTRMPVPVSAHAIALVIGVLATITATVGNLAALAQDNLKRLLAYSSIAHAGYMLMACAVLTGTSGAAAVMLYLVVYLFMNLGAFSVVAVVFRRTGSERMSAFAGLGRRAPLLAIAMTLFMVSLVGLPPLAGFGAKFQLFYALFVYRPYSLQWLVAVGLLNTLISLVYYMRVVGAMYFQRSDAPPLAVGPVANGWVLAMAVPVTLLLFVWQPLTRAADYLSAFLMLKP